MAEVEAGDRALETARKIVESITLSLTRHGVVNDDTDGSETALLTSEYAALIQSAMSAQERELRSKIADDVDAKMELLLDAVFEKKENMIKVRDVMRRTVMEGR